MSRGVCGQCGELYSDDFPCECMTPSPSPERMSEKDFGKWGLVTCYSTLFTEARRARESERDYMDAAAAEASERRRAHAEIERLSEAGENLHAKMREQDAEIEKWKAWEAQEREDKMHQQARADKAEFMRDKYETLAREFTERSIKAESRAARLAAVIPNLLAIIDAEVGECTCEQDWCSRCTEKALAEKGKS